MQIALLIAAYDSGHYNLRMGQGPLRLRESGILDTLRSHGHTIHETELHPDQPFNAEIRRPLPCTGWVRRRQARPDHKEPSPCSFPATVITASAQ
jgi:hypothetical protein